MTTKFSQFPSGGTIGVGAKIAGLDASVSPDNRIFDFPGLGILDTNGSALLGWSQPLSGTAVNYLEFQNALSGNPAVISAVGGDTDVGLYLTSQNDGNISLVPGGNGFTIISGTTAFGLPSGTTGQRPIGSAGYMRYNSDTGTLEYYDALSNAWTTLSAGGSVASVLGTAGRITSTGGVNPVIDIDLSYVGQTSIQNLGTITVGTWEADIVQPAYGGTGLSSVAPYSVVCGGTTGSGPFQVVSGLGSVGQVLTSNGAGTLPTWQAAGAGSVISVSGTANRITSTGGVNPVIDISAAYVGQSSIDTVGTIAVGTWNANAITVPYGGTGDASFTAYSVICGGITSTGSLQNVVGLGMLGQVLTSNGAGALPTWTSVAGGSVSSVSGTAGQIVVVNGATTPVVSIDPTYVGQTSITTLGTISTGTWNGSIIDPTHGGTGVNNGSNTLTLGGNLTTSGAFASVFTMTGATSVIFPTSGTLATTAGTVSTVSGTLNRITSTGGTTPIIDIAATYVGQTSITTLGTITTGTWNGTIVGPAFGGTGINNGSSTITLGGNLTTSGAFATTFTVTGATNVTFPTSGTLAILGNNDFNFSTQYRPQLKDYSETVNILGSVSGAVTIDLTLGNTITATATGNITSISVTNVPISGQEASFTLRATNFGAFTIVWPTGTSWPGGVTPTLQASGLSLVVFTTIDAGTTWQAFYPGQNSGTVSSVATGIGLTGGTITSTGTINVVINDMCTGRLTLSTNTPVTSGDVLAATTLYWTPYKGNYVTLYTSGAWKLYTFTQLSIAVPATTNTMYDVFVYDNSGVLTLSVVAWTSDTVRTTNVVFQDGIYVLNGSPQYRYLGSFRTTGVSGQTEDSLLKRYVYNYYNRVQRSMVVTETTSSWTYTTATFRQANGSTANQVEFVCGFNEDSLNVGVSALATKASGNSAVATGIGLSSTTVNSAQIFGVNASGTTIGSVSAAYRGNSYSIGRNYITWLEFSNAANTTTWYGTGLGLTAISSGTGLSANIFM